jgi:hypothetical protein
MAITKQSVDPQYINPAPSLPYNLRIDDFRLAMQDIYDFLYDVNSYLQSKRLPRLDDSIRPQTFTGMISDTFAESLAKHSRSLVRNMYHNGHPDLIIEGRHPENKVPSAEEGVEVKATLTRGGAVDHHGARDQWSLVCVYTVDRTTEPATDRAAMKFVEIYLSHVSADDFRLNSRGPLGTRTATLHRAGLARLREGWIYYEPGPSSRTRSAARAGIAVRASST